jgi:putative DNA primase/helicase
MLAPPSASAEKNGDDTTAEFEALFGRKPMADSERGDAWEGDEEVPLPDPPRLNGKPNPSPESRGLPETDAYKPIVVSLADVKPKSVDWLWPSRIPLGKPTIIAGDPGHGKSILTIDLAARVSRGSLWPDGSGKAPLGSVVLMSQEDDIADTILPRLLAAGGDPAKVVALTGTSFQGRDGKLLERPITLADVDVIAKAVHALHDCRLLVLDPVSCFLGDADSHKNAEVRAAMAPLVELAAARGFAVVSVNHLNRSNGSALNRSMGSVAFTALARAAYVVAKDKDDPSGERRLFLPTKNNLGKDRSGLSYRIVGEGGAPNLAWDEGQVFTSADEALAVGNIGGDLGEKKREVTEAEWQSKILKTYDRLAIGAKDGMVGYSEVKTSCGLNGVRFGRAMFLLSEAGLIEVAEVNVEMPKGGNKLRKTMRRLKGG